MGNQEIRQYVSGEICIKVGEDFANTLVTRITFEEDSWVVVQTGESPNRERIALIIPRPGDMFYY